VGINTEKIIKNFYLYQNFCRLSTFFIHYQKNFSRSLKNTKKPTKNLYGNFTDNPKKTGYIKNMKRGQVPE